MLAQLSGSLLHSPIISTETEGVGRAWTLSGSLLHLHRDRGSLEGPGPCLASATHSALISSSQQRACYHQPHTGVFSMAPGCSISLLLLVKTVGEGWCVAVCPWAGGMGEDSMDYKSRCSPPSWKLMGSRTCYGAMAEQFPSVCEFSFQTLPETHSILWIPTGAPMLHALEKRKGATRLSTWWEHSWGSRDKTVKMDPH